jgi:hypothetical protein
MVALFRIAKQRPTPEGTDVIAGILLALTMIVMVAPGGLFLFPAPWNTHYVTGQIVIWIAGLIFLVHQAWQEKRASVH